MRTAGIRATEAHLTREQRLLEGRNQRKRVSRNSLGVLEEKKRRFDPIDILLKTTEGRVPSLLRLKYQRMSASAFAFFRGAVSIMAADLARQPNSGIFVQLCGDAHVQNLGSFETPDGRLVFDINDFDETIRGPWEWDVKRMAASIVLAGIDSKHKRAGCIEAVEAFIGDYVASIEMLADQPILVAARHLIHRVSKAQAISAALQQAARARPQDLLKKYTEPVGNRFQLKKTPPVLWRLRGVDRGAVLESLALYRESLPPERLKLFDSFKPLDVGFKVVGTGSVGLRDYVVLMEGNGPGDPLFLQIKQEVASAYAPYLKRSPTYSNQGLRVAQGQRSVQPISDLMLGWTRIGEHDYLVRQLNDHKGSIDLTNLRAGGLSELAGVAGELLARGHVRSGDGLMIKGYIGTCQKVSAALSRYALEYAELAQRDFERFQQAIKARRISVAA